MSTYPHVRDNRSTAAISFCACGASATDGPASWGDDCPRLMREVLDNTAADLAALRIEHEAWGAIIDATRAARDEARAEVATLRAQVADLQRLGASIHKAADAARRAERADVVAWLHTDGPALAFASCIGGSEYTCAADAIGRGEHEGAATPK